VEPPLLYTKKISFAKEDNRIISPILDHDDSTSGQDSAKELLKEIRDLLKVQVRYKEQDDYDNHNKREMKKNWMLAAAVFDRICAIAFTIIFFAGTLSFITVIVTHHQSSSSSSSSS